jgi:hypothetical protein
VKVPAALKRPVVLGGLIAAALILLVGGLASAWRSKGRSASGAPSGRFTLDAYAGLGAWADVFDTVTAYQTAGTAPLVTPDDVDVMAAYGVKTLYLQAARLDDKTPGGVLDADLLASFLARAHAHKMRVVGWYLPKFADLDADLARLTGIAQFDHKGQRFDGVMVDIEDTSDVKDVATRNQRLVELSQRLRAAVGTKAALGAGVLPASLTEVVNPDFWPQFPWSQIAPYYNVWLPMAYWSDRKESSGYRSGYTYAVDSVARMRSLLGQPDAPVHLIGGIGNLITEDQTRDFLRAVTDTDAMGASIYDYRTMPAGIWDVLREGLAGAMTATPGPTTTLPAPTTTTGPAASTTTP